MALTCACRFAFSERLGEALMSWVWEDGHNDQTQFLYSPGCVQIMELLVLMIVLHWRKVLLILAVALVFGSVRDALSEPLIGRASVIDGDTIEIHGVRIRFNGIDAPEGQQLCQNEKGRDYRCGQVAADALANFLSKSRPTRCEFVERDQYDRFVGDCYRADGQSVSSWLVRSGHALDWPRYSNGAYANDQAAAKSSRSGMWAGGFQAPWEWRAERRESAAAPAPLVSTTSSGKCNIKGNISRKGERIYHVPGQKYYAKTQINERQGERWFCSEEEARKAGWRKSKT